MNPINYNESTHQVSLCARRTCCPKMELLDEHNVKVIDDNGNEVIMTIEQARLINPALDLLTEKKKQLLHD